EAAADLRGGWRVLTPPLALTRPVSLLVLVWWLFPRTRSLGGLPPTGTLRPRRAARRPPDVPAGASGTGRLSGR
ncbi:hypothetical protein, partial [Kineococcus glutinatus]|uniref:hypothetical protein n=1 Tax=Kineococcus glutinatus TaxID=1070872 RepID=UPI0031E83032